MSAESVDGMVPLVAARQFPCIGDADSRLLRFVNNVRMQHFVRQSNLVPFRRYMGGYAARIYATSLCCS
jgi:hypothetical protein